MFYIGDCVEYMNSMDSCSVDLTITSPPYNNNRLYKGYKFDYKCVLKSLFKVTKVGGVVVWVVNDAFIDGSESLTSFKTAIYAVEECGFKLHDTMIYQKNCYPFPPTNKYYQQFEYMFVFSKGTPKTTNLLTTNLVRNRPKQHQITVRKKDGSTITQFANPQNDSKLLDNVWYLDVGYNRSTKDKIAFNHPATFPEELVRLHLLTWSNEGDLIFDPMCGSGTTCKVAFLEGRKFVGVDCSDEYINKICIPRLESFGWVPPL